MPDSFQIHLVIVYFVPVIIMITCTASTTLKLRQKSSSNNAQLVQNAQRNRRISYMLIGMWSMYFFSSLPNRLCFSVFIDQLLGHKYTDLVLSTTNTLVALRNTVNIFFFYLSVNGFRRDLRAIFIKMQSKVQNHTTIEPTTNYNRVQPGLNSRPIEQGVQLATISTR